MLHSVIEIWSLEENVILLGTHITQFWKWCHWLKLTKTMNAYVKEANDRNLLLLVKTVGSYPTNEKCVCNTLKNTSKSEQNICKQITYKDLRM